MSSHLDLMVKPNTPAGGSSSRPTHTERRSSRRCKITQLMRLRPSDPERDPFDDIRGTISVSNPTNATRCFPSSNTATRTLQVS